MSCIVGLVEDKTVYMGADSIAVDENGGTLLNTYPKLFHNGDFLIGYTGSIRPGQLLQFAFKPPVFEVPVHNVPYYIAGFMVTEFIPALQECIEKAKLKEEDSKFIMLVGFHGRLFCIYGQNYQIEESAGPYNAIGCGGDLAIGSLYTSTADPPMTRVDLALQAAAAHNAHVREPFLIESI
jgi:hypothetical protein